MVCEVCGEKSWELSGHLTSSLIFNKGRLQLGGTAYPVIAVMCKNCGNTKQFNAVIMGLLDKEENDK